MKNTKHYVTFTATLSGDTIKYVWKFRVEIEHYSIVYFDRFTAFKAL